MAKKRGGVIRVDWDLKKEIEKFRKNNKLHSEGEVVRIWHSKFFKDNMGGNKNLKIVREIRF